MSLDEDTIDRQRALLAAHRRTLTHLVAQAAQYGGEVFAPPQTASGIAEARAEIARIKALLHENAIQVEDEPNDEAPPQRVAGINILPDLAPVLHQLRAPTGDFVGREREQEIGHPDAEADAARLAELRQRLAGSGKPAGRWANWWRRLRGRG